MNETRVLDGLSLGLKMSNKNRKRHEDEKDPRRYFYILASTDIAIKLYL